jgi:hypothetical protein
VQNTQATQLLPAVSAPAGINADGMLKTRQITGSYRIDTWIQLLQHLRYRQQQRENRARTGCLVFGILFVLAIMGGIPFGGISPILFFLAFAIAIVSFMGMWHTGQSLTKNSGGWSSLEYVIDQLKSLRADVRPKTPVQLQIDMRDWKQPAKLVEKVNRKDARKTIDTFYRDPWLQGEVRLADRSRLTWCYISRWRERETHFGRPSGKTKTRTKSMHKLVCVVKLRLRQRRYPHFHPVARQKEPNMIERYPRGEYTIVHVKQKYRDDLDNLRGRPLIAAIATAYSQIAAPPRSAARSTPAPPDEPPLLITAPDLQQGLLQAQARGAGVGAYIGQHNGQLYLSLDFIRDAQERQQVHHLLRRYQAGETLDTEMLTWLGKRLLG